MNFAQSSIYCSVEEQRTNTVYFIKQKGQNDIVDSGVIFLYIYVLIPIIFKILPSMTTNVYNFIFLNSFKLKRIYL